MRAHLDALEDRKSLLVVDDEQGMRDLMQFTFEPLGRWILLTWAIVENRRRASIERGQVNEFHLLGYEVIVVENGLQALVELTRRCFDLVILDIHMPVLAGPGALEKIRELRPSQRVLIVSSGSNAERIFEQRLSEAGTVRCLLKPVDLDDLIGAVEREVARRVS